jgi:iron(III) transport system substrate-binding protein
MASILLLFLMCLAGCGKRQQGETVVLYTSQDQVYAEPILKEFTRSTGVRVRALYDSESAKTAGLVHRLKYESNNPQCDVFWSNEEFYARTLEQEGLLSPSETRTFGYRTRRLVINTNQVHAGEAPKTLLELTNQNWNGKVVLSYPLFGTTTAHFLALRQLWGEPAWKEWCQGLIRNGAKVVDGNSIVVKMVGAGESSVGLTDWDDINAGKKLGYPIMELPLLNACIATPNTVGVAQGAPHPEAARRLRDYLASPEVVRQLVQLGALEGADPSLIKGDITRPDWPRIMPDEEKAIEFLKLVFTRK